MAGQGCGGVRLGHQLGRGHAQGCSKAGDVSSGLSGAGTDNSRGGNAILCCGRKGHLFPNRVSQVLRLKQSNQKPGFPVLL